MKNLFNDISQEEKNRILEMHSAKKNVISEQQTVTGAPIIIPLTPAQRAQQNQTPPSLTTPRPRPRTTTPVKVPVPKKIVVGTTIVLYSNSDETQALKKHKITTIVDKDDSIELLLSGTNDDGFGLDSPKLTFKCGSPTLEMDSKIMDYPKRVYNKDLINSIKNQFCSLNKKGIWVPKADFTMNNQQDDTSSRIA
jgi:hypothetical protein